MAAKLFLDHIRELVKQNKDIAPLLNTHLEKPLISGAMRLHRRGSLSERRELYSDGRIQTQLEWYAAKARIDKRMAARFFSGLLACNACAVTFAVIRIRYPATANWPADIFVISAAALLWWIQSKRCSELSVSGDD